MGGLDRFSPSSSWRARPLPPRSAEPRSAGTKVAPRAGFANPGSGITAEDLTGRGHDQRRFVVVRCCRFFRERREALLGIRIRCWRLLLLMLLLLVVVVLLFLGISGGCGCGGCGHSMRVEAQTATEHATESFAFLLLAGRSPFRFRFRCSSRVGGI